MTIRGFTLLEVMVAVAILGLGLTAILSAQAGAVSGATHARHMSVAVGLARCKMTEIEEQLFREGFQELDIAESGACCEGDDTPNISCEWRIEKPEMPEPEYGDLDLDTDLNSGSLGALGLLDRQGKGEQVFDSDATVHDVAETLAGENDMASVASAGMGGIAAMVMSMVYPDLQALFEASTRRVTVVLTWTEGSREYDIEIVQWITDPRQAGITGRQPGDILDQAEQLAGTATGTGTSTKTPTPMGRTR
ncbi:MAG: prepilin-type N-terminal cleavage/methylation domain-containing protein [Deltaproteobacteria bacterium]|nr:prepilin-type N-terminal cleavage/methylation domain-containing protein [Deltaproteobacteria bacterium]MBW2534105.1 prepilin-type N-terminal cleavage/methylation domain-containing protein [Deltaproteobacteria bacterium]